MIRAAIALLEHPLGFRELWNFEFFAKKTEVVTGDDLLDVVLGLTPTELRNVRDLCDQIAVVENIDEIDHTLLVKTFLEKAHIQKTGNGVINYAKIMAEIRQRLVRELA